MTKKFRRIVFVTAVAAGAWGVGSGNALGGVGELEHRFKNPPEEAKPRAMWMWMGSNITKSGISEDLEALHDAGFGGSVMFHIADMQAPRAGAIANSPTPEIISWTEPWWKMVRHAAEESKRLGLTFGMHNCPGYSTSGGPWITPELSVQQLIHSETAVMGPGKVKVELSRPVVDLRSPTEVLFNPETGRTVSPELEARRTFYRDIAVLALPALSEADAKAIAEAVEKLPKGHSDNPSARIRWDSSLPDTAVVPKDQVLDLSAKMDADGRLTWDVPEGEWVIYRFGHTTSGNMIQPQLAPASMLASNTTSAEIGNMAQLGAPGGLECDKLNPEAVRFHMDHVIGSIKRHLGDLVGTGIHFIHFDSFEGGDPSWTTKMREEFEERWGYDMTTFLPTFLGRTIGSKEETRRAKNQSGGFRQDLFTKNYYAVIREMLHDAGLKFSNEPYGWPLRNDPRHIALIDQPMAEFWVKGRPAKILPFQLQHLVNGARKAGHNIIEAEAFTAFPDMSEWSETPAWIKPIGDAAFCMGINRFVLHRFTHQPWDDRYKPGYTMGPWGTKFDRTQTWWEPGKAMFKYWQRCQALLQWGAFNANADFQVVKLSEGLEIKSIARTGNDDELYFVANVNGATGGVATCSFSVIGKQPELWNPVTGEQRPLPEFITKEDNTLIPLKFAPGQSWFVVFRTLINAQGARAADLDIRKNFFEHKSVQEVSGPWQVSFDPKWGGPEKAVVFDVLTDWTQRPEAGIKYYSGTAVYQTTFDGAGGDWLDLGVVNNIARVRLNGRDLGVVWCAPWGIRIPEGLLKPKGNTLDLEITNTWANRLIGDEQETADCEWFPASIGPAHYKWLKAFPEWFTKGEKRPSGGRYCFTTWNYFHSKSRLLSAGLLGPVRLMKSE